MSEGENNTAGVVAPPPLIFGGGLLAGLALDWAWPIWSLPETARIQAAVALVALGVVIAVGQFRRFARAGTAVDPYKPSSALVVTGLYRRSRNPIYLALVAVYLGLAAGFGGVWSVAMLAPVLTIMNLGVIAREERYLDAKFGEEYRAYKASVRRWL